MKYTSGLRTVRFMAVPLALFAISGCTVLESQKLAGEGNRMVQKEQLDDAVTKFNESLAKKDNDQAHAGLASAYLRQGRYADAEREANTAIKMTNGTVPRYELILANALLLQSQGPKAYDAAKNVLNSVVNQTSDPMSKQLAKDALLLQARIIQATGVPADSLKVLQDPNVAAKWPDDNDFRASVAVAKAMSKQYDEALSLAEASLKMKATQGDALLAKAMVQASRGQTAEVKQILGAPLREDHSRVLCFLSITRQLRIDKKNQEAVDLLNLLVEVMPNYYFIHSELAFVLLDLERYPESIKEHEITLATNPGVSKYASAATQEAFEAALKATPPTDYDRNNLAGYYDNLAFMYSKTNQEAKAMAALERSAATKPSIGAYQNLAAMYQRANKMDSAIVVLEKALALEPQNVDVMKALATLAFNTNQPDRAREYFKKAASVKGDDADIHLNLGVVLFNTKQPKEAAVEFAEAARLRPDSPEILYYLGIAQFESGDKKGADTTLKKVVELKPDYADAYRYLGNIAFEKKDYKNAEKYYALEDKYKGKKK